MKRRNFILNSMLGGVFINKNSFENSTTPLNIPFSKRINTGYKEYGFEKKDIIITDNDPIIIEKYQEGQPHKGKVFAAIQPHCDDIAYFAPALKNINQKINTSFNFIGTVDDFKATNSGGFWFSYP